MLVCPSDGQAPLRGARDQYFGNYFVYIDVDSKWSLVWQEMK
jgi:hypothetical protein